MGYQLKTSSLNDLLTDLSTDYLLFAPKRFIGEAPYSDLDSIRYGEVSCIEDMELDEKSHYSMKEVFYPISETLFYFTEDQVTESEPRFDKEALVFLRSCDLHSVKRLDAIYLENKFEDYYYKRLREKIKFVLIGCPSAYDNCFCVDMGTNRSENYAASIDRDGDYYLMDVKDDALDAVIAKHADETLDVLPRYVTETKTRVRLSDHVDPQKVAASDFWNQYDKRCIACGRCNFVCPTCTCFTMQDIFYRDNGRVGERRRVHASCMVDGFTDVAGGGKYRARHGERMRFKTLHKVYDFKKRFGYHMCTGCGRCDDVCPEYISFSTMVTEVADISDAKEAR
ncbi:MAG: anaerobic sulfite reductase subunit AsrA [Peptoniphilus sp.]|nr:anaerobic sulfite reductase subunit AsrA [Peptoniphilus sp.]MDD7362698.1 anaerobic sulfite reductase subunit AsrA [Bacillota bacterium]MDY6044903.1 anaerobic sulfite reductase subunit AsrA [Peptoniphilus sp.]